MDSFIIQYSQELHMQTNSICLVSSTVKRQTVPVKVLILKFPRVFTASTLTTSADHAVKMFT